MTVRRSGPCPRQWIFIACWFVGVASAADLPLREAAWLAPRSDRVTALTTAPAECFRPPADPAQAVAAKAGRIAFRSPLLLGGPAAKSGLSCHACHINGHGNPDFFIEGLSGAPGTVDVTSSRFSKTRGDGVFNPKTIPSLLDIARLRKAAEPGRTGSFVHGVIVDEFQGWKPAPSVFDALLAYVSALDPAACPKPRVVAIRLSDDLALIRRGAEALTAALDSKDLALTDFLLVSLRSLLGQVHERFELPDLEQARSILVGLGRELGERRESLSTTSTQASAAVSTWRQRFDADEKMLLPFESSSLYNPELLRARAAPEAQRIIESP
ncbi:MAG: hypothetical protein ACT4PZ_03430 [Panacagrimonas sp.]